MNNYVKKIKDGIWDETFLELLQRRAMKVNEHDLIFAINQFGQRCYDKGLYNKQLTKSYTWCPNCKNTDKEGYKGKVCSFCATKLIKDPLDEIFVDKVETLLSDEDVIFLNTWAKDDKHIEYKYSQDFRKGYHQAVDDIADKLGMRDRIDEVYDKVKRNKKKDVNAVTDEQEKKE